MPNPYVVAGAARGVGYLGRVLGGNSRQKKAQEEFDRNRASYETEAGKDIYNPYGISNIATASIRGRSGELGGQIDTSLGLDTGQGQGALFGAELEKSREVLANLILGNEQGKSRNKLNFQRDQFLNPGPGGGTSFAEGAAGVANIAGDTYLQKVLGDKDQANVDREFETNRDFNERRLSLAENKAAISYPGPGAGGGDYQRYTPQQASQNRYGDQAAVEFQTGGGGFPATREPTLLEQGQEAGQIFRETGLIPSGFKQGKAEQQISSADINKNIDALVNRYGFKENSFTEKITELQKMARSGDTRAINDLRQLELLIQAQGDAFNQQFPGSSGSNLTDEQIRGLSDEELLSLGR